MTEKETRSTYEWGDGDEKEAVERSLFMDSLIPNRQDFDQQLKYLDDHATEDIRYVVYMSPGIYGYDPKNKTGAAGPLEAIQAVLGGQVDGGWNWYVWDRKQGVGFEIESNSYIYAPLDAWAESNFGPKGFQGRSTQYLREVIDAAQSVLKERGGI